MRVLKIDFKSVEGCRKLYKAEAEVVNRPFSWCIEHKVYSIPMDIDPGPIEAENIPMPLFENWVEYGKDGQGRSEIIPDFEDLDLTEGSHEELRIYGTLRMVPKIDRTEYLVGDQGLLAYLQFILQTRYVSSTIDFQKDMMPAATRAVKVWDKDTIYRFVANVLGKSATNVSVADVAHVVRAITKQDVDISTENFSLLKVAQHMSTDVAAARRPDEFFMAAFPEEIMEMSTVKKYLTVADDGFYFGKGAQYPASWGVSGPESVLWKATVRRKGEEASLVWAPIAGTLLERAIDSKKQMFPSANLDVPFEIPLLGAAILDSPGYEAKPRDFNTGLRYLSVDQSLQMVKVAVPPTDISTIERESGRFVASLPSDPDLDETIAFLVKVYKHELGGVDAQIGERHFMVYHETLAGLAGTPKEVENTRDMERSSTTKRLEDYVLPGKPNTIRSILAYAWVLKHMDNDSLCYVAADNDDFSVESAITYVMDLCVNSRKPSSIYLVNCVYSPSVGTRKQGMLEAVGVDLGSDFYIQ